MENNLQPSVVLANLEPAVEQFDLSKCFLLPIDSGVKAKSESHHMKHAMWHMWQQGNFFKEGDKLYSMRDANEKRVLSLLVAADGTCKFVVGLENRRPTEEELQVLGVLLSSIGHTLDYTGPYYGQDH